MRERAQQWTRLIVAAAALLPAACAGMGSGTGSGNPFAGTWQTADKEKIAFADDTIVLSPPGGAPTPMTAAQCNGAFRYRLGRMARDSLTSLVAAQPDLHQRLIELLRQPVYQVIEIGCDHGTSTYVMLDDRDLVAIYRDRDVLGLDRMSRL
jgi:hypothetical protein